MKLFDNLFNSTRDYFDLNLLILLPLLLSLQAFSVQSIKNERGSGFCGAIKDFNSRDNSFVKSKLGAEPLQNSFKLGLDLAIFADHDLISRLEIANLDYFKFVRYLLKTVDLRFNEPKLKQVFGGKIEFRIVFSEIANGSLWLHKNRELKQSLTTAYYYALRHTQAASAYWDHAIFLTGENLHVSEQDIPRRTDVLGVAWVGQLCGKAILIEVHDFDSIWVLLHELGHAFGAHHDNEVGCEDTTSIMSDTVGALKTFWSDCTIKQWKDNVNGIEKCLHNVKYGVVPSELHMPVDLPGQVFTDLDLCRMGKSMNSVISSRESCRKYICQLRWFKWPTLALLEGTPCNGDGICCAGVCKSVEECAEFYGVSSLHTQP